MSMGTSLLLLILSAGLQVSYHSSCHSFKPSSFKPFSLSPPGLSTATNFNSLVAVPHRFHLDFINSHSHHSRSIKVDLLGRYAKLLIEISDNRLHHHPRLLCRTDEYRKSELALSNKCSPSPPTVRQFTCLSDSPCKSNFTTVANLEEIDHESHRRCALPQYISLSAAFAFICVSIFLR